MLRIGLADVSAHLGCVKYAPDPSPRMVEERCNQLSTCEEETTSLYRPPVIERIFAQYDFIVPSYSGSLAVTNGQTSKMESPNLSMAEDQQPPSGAQS
jgi:hypothetical protein